MLELILVYAVAYIIIEIVEKPFVKKIAFAQNTEDAISIRRTLIVLRLCISILFFGGYLWFLIAISDFENSEVTEQVAMYRNIILAIVAIFVIGFKQFGFKKLLGNISCLTKEAYLTIHEDFVLFLRGFNDDDYSDIDEIKKDYFVRFSEYGFMSLLEASEISACAVGMTKESDSPWGAKRIYVDDISWKEDVNELIEKASNIYILVRDRESCIWEIETSLVYLEKVMFIVDDVDTYNIVREKFKEKIALPQITELLEGAIVVISFKEGKFNAVLYSNSINGYAQILQYPQKELDKFKKKYRKARSAINFLDKKLLIFAVISCLVIFAISFYIEYNKELEGERERVERILTGEEVLVEKEKQVVLEEIKLKFEEFSKKLPLQIDENTILKNISYDSESHCIKYNYSIIGLEVEDVNMTGLRINIIAGLDKKQLGIYRMLGIELLYSYDFDEERREIRITKSDINMIYENLIKAEE